MRDTILSKIKPTEAERENLKKIFESIKKRFELFLPEDVEVCLVGSAARNTNLRGKSDFDVFMLFPTTVSRQELEEKGLHYAKRAVRPNKWSVWYAEHPYLRSELYGIEVDIVPAYKIKTIGEKMTAVDRTPLHTRYLKDKLKSERIREDVLILKQFLKANGLYGAELKVEGFSGYLCELMILNYNSFENLIKNAVDWKPQIVIDIEKHATKKFSEPLVVIDPVDSNRNVASAVSETSFARFIVLAREYLKAPKIEMFFPPSETRSKAKLRKDVVELMEKHNMKMAGIVFDCPKIVEDLLWPQLKKTTKGLVALLERAGFSVFDYAYWSDNEKKCAILVDLNNDVLPKVKKAEGPFVYDKEHCKKFFDAHHGSICWVMDGRAYCLEERKPNTAKELIKSAISGKESWKIGADLDKKLKKAAIVMEEKELLKSIPLDVLYNFLKKKELPMITGGKEKVRVVLTGGVFDLLHEGHVKFLERCKAFGDKLVVVVASDDTVKERKGKKPINSAKKRAEVLKRLKMVDGVVIGGKDWIMTAKKVNPDIIILGYDQTIDENQLSIEIIKKIGKFIPICRVDDKYGRTKTSKLIEKIKKR